MKGAFAVDHPLSPEDVLYLYAFFGLLNTADAPFLREIALNGPMPLGRKIRENPRKLRTHLLTRALRPNWRPYLEELTRRIFGAEILREEDGPDSRPLLERARDAVEEGMSIAQAYWVLQATEGEEAEDAALAILEEHETDLDNLIEFLHPAVEMEYRQAVEDAAPPSTTRRERDLLLELEAIKQERDALRLERDALADLLQETVEAHAEDLRDWAALLAEAKGEAPRPICNQGFPLAGMRVLTLGDPGHAVGYREILEREFQVASVEFRDATDFDTGGFDGADLVVLITAFAKHKTEHRMDRHLPEGVPVVYVPVAGLGMFRRKVSEFAAGMERKLSLP